MRNLSVTEFKLVAGADDCNLDASCNVPPSTSPPASSAWANGEGCTTTLSTGAGVNGTMNGGQGGINFSLGASWGGASVTCPNDGFPQPGSSNNPLGTSDLPYTPDEPGISGEFRRI